MFHNLFKSKKSDAKKLYSIWNNLKTFYKVNELSEKEKENIEEKINKYGYLPMSHIEALNNLTDAQTLYAVELKLKKSRVLKDDNKFNYNNNETSPLVRYNIDNSNWLKHEQHNIKLVNLAGLGDGNKTAHTGRFIDWLRQLAILPSGNIKAGIFPTTIYLIPFHPREFGCAYLPLSSQVSKNLEDKDIKAELKLNAKEQVQLFIKISQLADHPVIFDILPQTGRFSKIVLSNPDMVRWFDVNQLVKDISSNINDEFIDKLSVDFDRDDVITVSEIYKKTLKSGSDDISQTYREIYKRIDEQLLETKKKLSNDMLKKENQKILAKKARDVIACANNTVSCKIKTEDDIQEQGKIIHSLIENGLWPSPGGAWCSCGHPVFDKMSECGTYPVFRHFDIDCNDVSCFANLDCQSPYYFVHLEDGTFNEKVIDSFIKLMERIQADYNFDGYRVDHIDHIVDRVSEKNEKPISYRAPRKVLGLLNKTLKSKIPYFATLAEYMLWDDFYKEYHEDMGFDVLWGNDIVNQFAKTPKTIVNDNHKLEDYNLSTDNNKNQLSILKTYNNQDGEFRAINQYPGQLGERGALFKLFKYKFLPGGKNANRPMLFVDGDESFTKKGIESVIGAEVSMPRENNNEFFFEFDAIIRFARDNELTHSGESQIIVEDEDGFAAWFINKEASKNALLIVTNYNPPTQIVNETDENGESQFIEKTGECVYNKPVALPSDYKITGQIEYNKDKHDFVTNKFEEPLYDITFNLLQPSEYKIYTLER